VWDHALSEVGESAIELSFKLVTMVGKILIEKKIVTSAEWDDYMFNATKAWVEGDKQNVNNEGANGADTKKPAAAE
jgi:hypothetical protein